MDEKAKKTITHNPALPPHPDMGQAMAALTVIPTALRAANYHDALHGCSVVMGYGSQFLPIPVTPVTAGAKAKTVGELADALEKASKGAEGDAKGFSFDWSALLPLIYQIISRIVIGS